MDDIIIKVFVTLLLLLGWLFIIFRTKSSPYFIAYVGFSAALSLFVTSIIFIGGWAGMFFGFISTIIIVASILTGIIIFIRNQQKNRTINNGN